MPKKKPEKRQEKQARKQEKSDRKIERAEEKDKRNGDREEEHGEHGNEDDENDKNDATEKFASGGDEESKDIYDEENREEMLENDEITAAEEGFMRGREGDVEGGRKDRKGTAHKDTTSVELVKGQYGED